MDYNNFNNSSDGSKYRATRNLNTALENPQFNASDTFDVNLGKVNNFSNVQLNVQDNKFDDSKDNQYNVTSGNLNNNVEEKEVIKTTISSVDNDYNDGANNIVNGVNTFVDNVSINDNNKDANSYYVSNDVDIRGGNETLENNIEKEKVTYAPINNKRKKKVSITIPAELKIMIVLVIIILAFIYIIPNLYEFFRSIRLSILGR